MPHVALIRCSDRMVGIIDPNSRVHAQSVPCKLFRNHRNDMTCPRNAGSARLLGNELRG